jgi:hypothetical protein
MSNQWIRRRWYDFRMGHSLYLIFLLSFSNFILIAHRLLIERVPVLNEMFSNLIIFAIIFIIAYIPVSMAVGLWHRRTQLRVEVDLAMRQNPIFARAFATIIDIQTGKASPEQIEKFRKTLQNIDENISSKQGE